MARLVDLLWRAVMAEPSLDAQLAGVVLAAVATKLLVLLVRAFVRATTHAHGKPRPWYLRAVQVEQRKLTTMLGVKDPQPEWAAAMWVDWWAIGLTHGIGGALCLPAVAMGPTAMACRLARWGALVEVGWEVTDLAERWYQRLCTKDGHIFQPAALLALACLHHPLACCLVIPMNICYPTMPLYFQMVFLLMFAASSALFVSNWAQTLDVSSTGGLCKMVLGSLFLWAMLIFTRLTYYWTVVFALLQRFDEDGRPAFWWVGAFAAGVLMPLVGLAFFADASKRLAKFSALLWRRAFPALRPAAVVAPSAGAAGDAAAAIAARRRRHCGRRAAPAQGRPARLSQAVAVERSSAKHASVPLVPDC